MSNNKLELKRKREQNMVNQMIRIYCKKNHKDQSADGLCEECKALLEYSKKRSERCPFMETKTFCNNCTVHCYSPEMKEKIRNVMRFSGPRMLIYHPVTCIWHGITGIINKKNK